MNIGTVSNKIPSLPNSNNNLIRNERLTMFQPSTSSDSLHDITDFKNKCLFKRDAMIVALKNAHEAVSTRLGLGSSAIDKKNKIKEYIAQLNSMEEDQLSEVTLNKLEVEIKNFLNRQRASFFQSSRTNSGSKYDEVMTVISKFSSAHRASLNNRKENLSRLLEQKTYVKLTMEQKILIYQL